jgi:hypothetical protein
MEVGTNGFVSRLFRFSLTSVLWLALFWGCVTASASDPVRIRDLNAKCGLYVTPLENNSNGFRVADLDATQIREYVLSEPDLKDKALYIVGTSLYGKDKKALIKAAEMALTEVGLENPVRTIRRPKNILEYMRFLFLMPEDYQRPTKGELIAGAQKMAISGTVPIIVLLMMKPWIIAIPAGLVNFVQSSLMTAFRRTAGNWNVRSYYKAERFFKQMVLSIIFTMGIYFSKNWPDLPQILTGEGMGVMMERVGGAVAFNTLWRTLFHNGVYAWEESMTKRGLDVDARRTAARLEMFASLATTPFWMYSTISDSYLMDLGLMKFNMGHAVMTGTAAVGAAIWSNPKILDPSVKLMDGLFGKINGVWLVAKRPFTGDESQQDKE